jgi:hypothetical protein
MIFCDFGLVGDEKQVAKLPFLSIKYLFGGVSDFLFSFLKIKNSKQDEIQVQNFLYKKMVFYT